MKSRQEGGKRRVAFWLQTSQQSDPRNDDDYDTWDVGMEPLPGDYTWTNEKAPSGADG